MSDVALGNAGDFISNRRLHNKPLTLVDLRGAPGASLSKDRQPMVFMPKIQNFLSVFARFARNLL